MDLYQEEVLTQFGVFSNKSRFEFLRRLLDLMPDGELHGVKELVVKAVKRRKRSQDQRDKKNSAPVPFSVPAPVLQDSVPVPESAPVPAESTTSQEAKKFRSDTAGGWYRKFKKAQFISIDVEKVELYIHPSDKVVCNAQGKPKKYNLKAGSVSVADFSGKVIYNELIQRKTGSFRENFHSKNGFRKDSLDSPCLKTITTVQQELRELFKDKVIIGCDLKNDFDSLDLPFGDYSEQSFDLQWHFFNASFSTKGKIIIERCSLKELCKSHLNLDTQMGRKAHTAEEDAVNTMRVFRDVYVKIKPEPQTKDPEF